MMPDQRTGEIVAPGAFNERFTLYLNTTGTPVQRSLREMTADEVVAAIKYQVAESNRLEAEAKPWQPAAGESDEQWKQRIGQQPDLRDIVALLRRAGAAQCRAADLMQLVNAQMPQWSRHPKMGLHQAVRRWWPGGRSSTI